ncbi:hypothetical protein CY35_03G119300 [Sphagnum magellanicum]|nr:hypothetical protein CY35_03G119300 [Sphagnum magellanicum]
MNDLDNMRRDTEETLRNILHPFRCMRFRNEDKLPNLRSRLFSLSAKSMVVLGNYSFLSHVAKLTDLSCLATTQLDSFFLQKSNSLPIIKKFS